MIKIEGNEDDGMTLTFEKYKDHNDPENRLKEYSYVQAKTEANISFGWGFVKKDYQSMLVKSGSMQPYKRRKTGL